VQRNGQDQYGALPDSPSETLQSLRRSIFLDYTSLSFGSGVLHDQLICNLQRIAQEPSDGRHVRALFELAICKASRFGDPNEMKPRDAVLFLSRAAEAGDITAKGYLKRLIPALHPELAIDGFLGLPIEKWTFEAAIHGHEAALEEIRIEADQSSETLFEEVLRRRAIRSCWAPHDSNPVDVLNATHHSNRTPRPVDFLASDSQMLALHTAVRLGHIDKISHHIKEIKISVDAKNMSGDTPLIVACEVGSFPSALALLEHGAQLGLRNAFGETALHHLWRFSDTNAEILLQLMCASPQFEDAFFAEAVLEYWEGRVPHRKAGSHPSELDPLPLLPGLPIERIAGRGRFLLVKQLLQEGPALTCNGDHPANGNLIKRMVLWASRLTFPEIRELLVLYSREPEMVRTGAKRDPDITDVEQAEWTFERTNLDYMSGVAQGWIGLPRHGWRNPERFWRLCAHGSHWKAALVATIQSLQESWATISEQPFQLCHFEKALDHALKRRHTEFLHCFLTLYVDIHNESPLNSQHHCITYSNPQDLLQGFDHSADPGGRARTIDSVLFNKDYTLLQRSIAKGQRDLFSLLVTKFDADLLRPWSSGIIKVEYSGEFLRKMDDTRRAEFRKRTRLIQTMTRLPLFYLNCYSLLACGVEDVWFALVLTSREIMLLNRMLMIWQQTIPETGSPHRSFVLSQGEIG
jgi:hypothetical protein